MSRKDITNAIATVSGLARSGQIVDIPEAILDSIADLNLYVLEAFQASLRNDSKAVVKHIQTAQMSAATMQLTIPGMDHAALPALVVDLEAKDRGELRMKPLKLATLSEVEHEVSNMERRHAAQGRVIGGYRETLARIKDLVEPDEAMTVSEMLDSLQAITS